MSERAATIGSMYGFHTVKLPDVTHECREADEKLDEAECVMCRARFADNVWPGHRDLEHVPEVRAALNELFMELMTSDFESFSCPFPETDQCRSLRRRKRPK